MSVTTTTTQVRRTRRQTEEERSPALTVLRLLGGWATLGVLAWLLWTPGHWAMLLLAWVGLTILADEFGGWFGYIGAVLGGLPFFSPSGAPDQWPVVLPLVGGALLALLLVKHSGGMFVLPFAGAVYALPLLAIARFGTKLDPGLTLPANSTFQRAALLGMVAGLAFSFVRQLVGVILRYSARKRVTQTTTVTNTVFLDEEEGELAPPEVSTLPPGEDPVAEAESPAPSKGRKTGRHKR